MFWGIVLENGKRYTQVVDDGFHISMAALEPQWDKKGKSNIDAPVSVMMEREKTEFLLCTLSHGKRPQQPLDLNFAEGEAVTLFLNGEGIVHLTGYVVEAEPDDQEFSYGEEEEEKEGVGQEDSDDDDESDDLANFYKEEEKALKRKSSPKKQNEKAAKKPKVESSDEDSSLGEEDDDEDDMDDSDDDSYEQLMLKDEQSKSPKKAAGKTPIMGVPFKGSQSPPTPKKVTIVETPKSEVKQKSGPKTPAPAAKGDQQNKNAKGLQTPLSNGEKSPPSPDYSMSESSKKKKKRNKKKKSLGSPGAATPQENAGKTPKNDQNNTQKTPGKSANIAVKTPSKGPNNAEKTPGKVQKKLPGGVIIEDMQVGHGPEAKLGKMVHVHYIGKLTNNKEFDSCVKGQQPFKFRLGSNEVIKGWDSGIQGMKVGGRRKIVVPPQQGYGNKAIGAIPSNSTLNFEVQLVSIS